VIQHQVEEIRSEGYEMLRTPRWRTVTGVSIIAIIKDGNSDINPGPDTVINEGDMVVLIGHPEKVDQAIESFLIKAE
jgi:K+/H+ antiporter YhaU regulatory subunit KhtT